MGIVAKHKQAKEQACHINHNKQNGKHKIAKVRFLRHATAGR
jgi:hypothetical protein